MAEDRPTITTTTTGVAPAPEGANFQIQPSMAQALLRLRPGDHLSDFSNVDVIIQRVALGGFGLVFLGPDASKGERMFALKTLRPDLLARSANPQRLSQLFLREALTWVGLWPHPNLLRAHYATEINGVLFLTLDYAPYSLRDLLKQPQMITDARGQVGALGRLPLGTALLWAQQIAAGLQALHTLDPEHLRPWPLVHRDLKPENVLLDEGGRAMITDFGLAKVVLDAETAGDVGLRDPTVGDGQVADSSMTREANTRSRRYQTQHGVAMGTLAYMAPEQWVDAASAGPPADLYAFGIMLAELFAGRHALLDLDQSHTEEQWRAAHLAGVPLSLRTVEPQVPEAVEALYQGLLAKRAEARPTAAVAVRVLGEGALALGEEPYVVPAGYANIPPQEIERIFWQSWANTYGSLGLYHGALERIERALALDPTDYRTLTGYGNRLLQLRRLEEALAAYTTALANCPTEQAQPRMIIHAQRAMCLSEMGLYAEADSEFAEALVLIPDNTPSWRNRSLNQSSWARATAGSREEQQEHLALALDYAHRALASNPHNLDLQRLVANADQAARPFSKA